MKTRRMAKDPAIDDAAESRVAILGGYWGIGLRNKDRALRRFLRSECFLTHRVGEPCPFGLDVPLAGLPGDGDPPVAPEDLRLSNAFSSGEPSPSASVSDLRKLEPQKRGVTT